MKYAFTALILAVGFSTILAQAAGAPPVPSGLLACEQIQDSTDRVRCYDNQIAAMKRASAAQTNTPPAAAPAAASRAAPAAGAPAAAPAPAAPAAVAPAQAAQFGQEDLPHPPRPKAVAQNAFLQSSITSIRNVGPDIYLISLENGQIWRQDITSSPPTSRFFREGDEVHVEKGLLGSYHLSVPRLGTKNWVLVTRVR
jgi:hypothetical protein